MNRKEKIQAILNKLNLKYDYLKYLDDYNKGKDNPYHNNEHCFTVAINCFEGAIFHNLSENDTRNTVIAALFHDFNHSAGIHTDDINVQIAIEGTKDFLTNIPKDKEYFNENNIKDICNIISVTQYPFIKTPHTLQEKIIRDSDLMQYLEPDGEEFLNGLAKELNLNLNWEQTFNFIDSQTKHTEWGEQKLSNFKDIVAGKIKTQKLKF